MLVSPHALERIRTRTQGPLVRPRLIKHKHVYAIINTLFTFSSKSDFSRVYKTLDFSEKMGDRCVNTFVKNSENFHAGRGYPVNEQSAVRDVTIRPLDNGQFSWLVFQIPHKHIRPGAHAFMDFKKNGEATTYRKLLAMFIELITFMSTRECSDANYVNTTVFLETITETVPKLKHTSRGVDSVHDVPVATRIHFLCNREKSYPNQALVADLLKYIGAKEKQKRRKLAADIPMWEEHYECSDMKTWLQYLSAYSPDVLVTEYQKMLNNETNFDPLTVFSLQEACKLLKRGNSTQRCYEAYKKYPENHPVAVEMHDMMFPREDLIVQITPQDISITNLFYNGKYLPCFFFERAANPRLKTMKVTFSLINEHLATEDIPHILIEQSDHPFLQFKNKDTGLRIVEILERLTEQVWRSNFEHNKNALKEKFKHFWVLLATDFDEIKDMLSEAFYILTLADYTDAPPAIRETTTEAGMQAFLSCRPKFVVTTRSSHHFSTGMPGMKKLLDDGYTGINKHADRMDLIKYQVELTRGCYASEEDFEEKMMDLFATVIIEDEEADVSAPMSAMLKWYHHERSHELWKTYRKDEDGSVFMNSIIWKLNFLETYACVRKDFQMMMLVLHGSLDAYRQELNLHINACLTGTGAVSKSFVMLKMKELRIPGTVTKLTYKTAKADAIDSDRNDTITIFEEAPSGMFSKSDKDPEKEEMFKEKLTSMECTVLTYEKNDDTGERYNREVKSQCIGVFFGATNDDPEKASDAMKTRFIWGGFEEIETDRTVSECMHGEQESKTTCSEHYNRCLQYFYMEQFQVMVVYKMIYIGLIPDPTMEAADVVFTEMEKKLRKDKIMCPARFGERYRALCKVYTIINAINTVFNYVGGECCLPVRQCQGCANGQACCRKSCGECQGCTEETGCQTWCQQCRSGDPCFDEQTTCEEYVFDPRDMLRVKPYLYCTEEIALYAFTQLSGEVYNSNEYKIKESIWNTWKSRSGKYEQVNEISEDMNANKGDNYDRIQFDICGAKLVTVIKNNIPLSQGKPSEYNIKQVLTKLKQTTFTFHKYVKGTDEHNVICDNYPIQDTRSETRTHEGYTIEPPKTFFPLALFEEIRSGSFIDPIVEAALSCQHKYTYEDKKIILGFPEKYNSIIRYPSVFQTVVFKPNPRKIIRSVNTIYKTDLDMKIQHRGMVLQEEVARGYELQADTDDDACAAHGKRIGYEGEQLTEFAMRYSVGALFQRILVDPNPIDYPREALANLKERSNRETQGFMAKNTHGITFVPRTSKRRRIGNQHENLY